MGKEPQRCQTERQFISAYTSKPHARSSRSESADERSRRYEWCDRPDDEKAFLGAIRPPVDDFLCVSIVNTRKRPQFHVSGGIDIDEVRIHFGFRRRLFVGRFW